MSGPYGCTSAGFLRKDGVTIASEVDADLKKILGASAGSESDGSIPPSSFAGQLKALIVKREIANWDLLQSVYAAKDARTNGDSAQDSTAVLVGAQRQPAEQSTATVTCTGDPNTLLKVGRVVATSEGVRFDSDAEITILELAAWVALTAYAIGDRVTNAGRAFLCIAPGTSAASGGPTTTDADITDGTVHWRYMGQGTGAIDVGATAELVGPLRADSGTLTQIATPVAGWRSAINLLDAVVGQYIESNAAFRRRRDAELQATGNATVDAIRSDVLRIGEGTNNPVVSCRVFSNDTDVVDADGLAAHSVEVLVRGGADADVALAIWRTVSGGTRTLGTTAVVVQDSEGKDQTVRFTRPEEIDLWIIADVTYYAKAFPADLAAATALLKDQIVYFGDSFVIGESVRSSALEAQLFDGYSDPSTPPVAGVLDVTSLLIGLVDPPVASTTIPIGARQLAVFDTSRVSIVLTPGTP